MATYNVGGYYQATYNDATNTATVQAPWLNDPFVINDSEGDSTFEVGDTLTGLGAETFVGYTADGGVVSFDGVDYWISYGAQPSSGHAVSSTLSVTESTFTTCYVEGTRIATPDGERAVEALAIGDQVLTLAGEAVAVRWIGRQTRNPFFAALNAGLPVCLRAGALGEGLPRRDLHVSPDHALLVDGLLVHASALVNGRSITLLRDWPRDVEYYHIETAAHELVLAEGTPAETFIDNVTRERFDNHAEYAALYPDTAPMVELDLPRVKFARQLPRRIRDRLAAVADTLVPLAQTA